MIFFRPFSGVKRPTRFSRCFYEAKGNYYSGFLLLFFVSLKSGKSGPKNSRKKLQIGNLVESVHPLKLCQIYSD